MTVTPDQLTLHEDGMITLAFGPAPIDVARPQDGTFVPAYRIPRPVTRQVRAFQDHYHDLNRQRVEAQKVNNDAARVLAGKLEDGTAVEEDAEPILAAAADMITTTEQVMWGWWSKIADELAVRIEGPWPRDPDIDDAPPWLTRNALVYNEIVEHWITIPLVRGDGQAPTATALPRVNRPVPRR